MITVQDILAQLKNVKRQGNEWQARCPAHDDSKPSLSVREGEGGKVLTHCHAGCTPEAVWAALHIESNGSGKREIAAYDYLSDSGDLLFQSVRYAPKNFLQRRPDGQGGWDWKLNGTPRVLYRLPELIASDPSRTVLIVEGEKDCDRLVELGQVATTNAGGAGKWRSEYSRHLAGRKVAILPDNDDPGRKHAHQVAESLSTSLFGQAASVKIVELPGLADKGDVSDWLDAGGTVHDLRSLVLNAPECRPIAAIAPREVLDPSDYQASWPMLGDAALYGLAGNVVRVILPHTESDPVALLIQILAAFGNAIGRSAYFVAESTRHYLNLFVLLVALTSKGRKGSSWNQVFRFIFRAAETWATNCISSAPSSGEALIWMIRDKVIKQVPIREKRGGQITGYEPETVDEGVADKRMLVFMSEFASMLRVMTRDGNTTSMVFRQLWDSDEVIRINNKNSPIRVTGPHLSSVGHITKDEYLRSVDETDKVNGFANRILHVCAKRSKCLPEGGSLKDSDLNSLVQNYRKALEFAQGVREMRRDEAARDLWGEVYPVLSEGHKGMLGAVTSRAEAQVMRLACVYALLDCSDVIRRVHLEAALALWQYCEDSARYVFGDSLGDHLADEILSALREVSEAGLTRSQIRDLFGRNKDADKIGSALKCLAENGLACTQKEYGPNGGRPIERWLATQRPASVSKPVTPDEEFEIDLGAVYA